MYAFLIDTEYKLWSLFTIAEMKYKLLWLKPDENKSIVILSKKFIESYIKKTLKVSYRRSF